MRGEGWKNNELVEVRSQLAIMRPTVDTFGGMEGLVIW